MRLIDQPSWSSFVAPVREYRVTFWQKQLRPPGVPDTGVDMAWSALHFDFGEVEDVHEVIEWAESHFEEHTNPESGRGYVIGFWTPEGVLDHPALIRIAGFNPTLSDGMAYNLRWRPDWASEGQPLPD